MKHMKRLMAAILVASLLLGSNGVTYAAEESGAASTESAAEEFQEMAEETSKIDADESGSAEDAELDEDSGPEENFGTEEDFNTEENSYIEEAEAEPAGEITEEVLEEASDDGKTEAAAEEATVAASEQVEEVFEAGELSYKGKDYKVTLAYDENAQIPAGARLKVREIAKGTTEYEAYLQGAQSAADKDVAEARFFDITILVDGKEVQPKSPVRVSISFGSAIEVEDEGEVTAMHFEDGTKEAEVLDTDTNGGSEVSEIAFNTESFSIFGVVFTKAADTRESGGTQQSTDLTNFLTKVIISGATQNEEGRYVVEQGKEYNLIATFAESASYQFQNDAELTYQMPQGIAVLREQTGQLKINIVYKGKTYEVDASYRLTTDGTLTVKFDENDPDYSKLTSSTNVSFRFSYYAQFDGTATEIKFSDLVERDIVFDEPEPGQAYVNKSAVFDESTGKFNYTIIVTANGDVENVNVKDVITGDALSFNNDVHISGNSSGYTGGPTSNGFNYTFASMSDGEEITITYSADVDFSKDGDNDGKITVDQTKNTATVQPEGGEPHNSEYSREISYKSTTKSAGEDAGATAEGDKIIEWTVGYNVQRLAAVGGDLIRDTISGDSIDYMKYYGDGITVNVYDKNGSLVRTDNISYSQLFAYSDTSWTYKIPNGDTAPYYYEITYQTVVDMTIVDDGGVTVQMNNDANGVYNGVSITPGNLIGVTKEVESFSTEEISWVATLSIPEGGLAQAIAKDQLPRILWGGRWLTDVYKSETLEITGLLNGESYDVAYSDTEIVITFFKDAAKTQPGLQGTPGGHIITVKLTTLVDQDWLNAGYEEGVEPRVMNHTNTIDLNGKTDYATVTFGKPGIEKKANVAKDEDGNITSIMYSIVLVGVSDTPVSIEDTFDTSILEVDPTKADEWGQFKIFGGNQYDQSLGRTPVSYSETADGLLITANTVPVRADGQYYSHYKITYYLRLKDGVDLNQLAIENGGEYDLVNTAKWNGHESEFSYNTVYDYLDKELLNRGELGGTNRTAKYKITFNSAKAVLNGGDTIELKDTLSPNLSIDYGSISISTEPEGESVAYSLSGNDEDGTVATYQIPDATKVVITYDAMVVGNGEQIIVNKVEANGKEETVEVTKSYGSAGEGDGAVASFKIVKVDGYDASKKLSGVQFKFFAADPGLSFIDGEDVKELILTTDENGEVIIDGGATIGGKQIQIFFEKEYHLREIEAPENYGTVGFDYLITLTNDMSMVDYGHYIYYYSDSMQIKNWPLEGLVIEKQVESEEDDDFDRNYNFKISILNEDGSVNTDFNEQSGDDEFVNGVFEFELHAGEQKMFWGFEKGTRYKVEEILTDEDGEVFTTSVSYDVFDEDGNVTEHKTENALSHSGELTQDDETIVFTNARSEKGSLKVKKVVNGDNAKDEYEIAVKNSEGHYFDIDGTDMGTTPFYVTFTMDEEKIWENIDADTYTVEEKDASVDGYTWTVTGTDNVEVTAGEEAYVEVTNTYVKGAEAEIEAKKNFTGREWKTGDTFEFTLASVDGAPMPSDAQTVDGVKQKKISVSSEDAVSFGTISYSEIGTYEYTITETKGNLPGVTYDTEPHTVTVTVVSGNDGNLEATVDYGTEGAEELEITNTFESVKAQPEVTKSINEWGTAESFTFTLAAKTPEDAPMPEDDTAVATRDAALAKFGEIEYTEPGTYIYTITETDDYVPGITYDAEPHIVKVVISQNADTNVLSATVTYDDGDTDLEITNTFTKAEAELKATKAINDWGTAVSFTFNLAAVDGAPMPVDPETGEVVESRTVTKGGSLTAVFGTVEYGEVGQYKYTITEVNDGVPGITYDTIPHNVVVDVHKAEDSNALVAVVTYDDENSLTIINRYASANMALQATKEINEWGDAESFRFTLAAVKATDQNGVTIAVVPMPADPIATATKNDPTAVFGSVEYKIAGTYEYTITEIDDGVPGITYDTVPHKAIVTVERDPDGNLVTSAKYDDSDDSLTITNTFTSLKKNFEATKSISDWGKATSFTFKLKAETDGAPMPDDDTATVIKGGSLKAVFGEIEYMTTGEYDYTITEQNDHVDGITYDTTPHAVHVSVTKNKDTNALEAKITYDDAESLTITNSFTAAEAEFEVTKVFDAWGKADSFTFDLKAESAADPDGNEITPIPVPDNMTATATETDRTAKFGKIKYEQTGYYVYTITERNGEADGVTYDVEPHTVVVSVYKDEETNELTAEVYYDDAERLTITNTYASTKATIEAMKDFDAWGKAESFTFKLAAKTEGAPMPKDTSVTATQNEPLASFGEIEYEEAGIYEYTITEVDDGIPGITYDTTAHKVVVTVTKANDATNALTADVKYDGESSLTIINRFASAKATLQATKSFNAWGKAESFTFDLAAVTEGAPMPENTTAVATENAKTAVFGEIEFKEAGEYKYTITERNDHVDGVAYDTTPHEVVVTVTKDGGDLFADVTYDGNASLTITNTFTTVTTHVEATKILDKRDWLNADEFEFELAAVTEGAPMPGENTIKATKEHQTAVFGDMTFDKAGTYQYTITEKDGGRKGITYDTEPHNVTVTVTKADDATNELTVTVAYDEAVKLEITNTYASKGDILLNVKKELKGRHIALDEEMFEFQLMDEEGNVLQTAKNDAVGNVSFDQIVYTQDDIESWDAEKGTGTGTKKYKVKELIKTKDGYTFDESEFEITVTLTDDGEGAITAEADKGIDDLVFTNEYKAEGEIVLHAKKVFLSEKELKEGQFTFELKDENGDVIDTKTNAADGTVTFDAIKYTQDSIYIVDENGAYTGEVKDQYTYTIHEVIPEGAKDNGDGTFEFEGYTYDGTVYTITVVLTDNGDGTITAADAAVPAEGETESRYVFTNAYKAEGTLNLEAEKEFKYGKLKGGEFTFELKDADGNVLQSKKNDAAGKVSFDMITYMLADVAKAPYTYTVSEAAGTQPDVKYDQTVYTVTVSIEDNGDGKLTVTKQIDKGGELKFVNEQTDLEASVTIGGVKVLKEKDLKAGQFKFVMADENGETVGEATNDADGNFSFGTITYKLSDLNGSKKKVYTYEISEVKGKDREIIYDQRVYAITVTVTYENGKMNAVASKNREDIRFVNTINNNTGDEAPLGVLFGGLGLGAVGLAVLLEERRRRNNRNDQE